MYLHLSIIHFYHFLMVTLQTNFDHSVFIKNSGKACTKLLKNPKKTVPKNRNGQILSTF